MLNPSVTHVVFDLDGTLLNTLEDLTQAGNHICDMRGWPTYTQDEFRYKIGNGQLKLIERLIPAEFAGDAEVFERALADFRAYYAEHKEDHTAPYPGILAALDTLKQANITLAVLTNKDHIAAAPLVERYFGSGRFAYVQGRIDAYPPKPAAPVTLHVLDQIGAESAQTLYVGDSDVDVRCGHNAGMRTLGVVWGFRGRAELEAAGADLIAETPDEMARLILGR